MLKAWHIFFLLFISCLIPCVDINECAQDGLPNCGPDTSICENIPGSFLCNCKVGFTNDKTQTEGKLYKLYFILFTSSPLKTSTSPATRTNTFQQDHLTVKQAAWLVASFSWNPFSLSPSLSLLFLFFVIMVMVIIIIIINITIIFHCHHHHYHHITIIMRLDYKKS